MAAPPPLEKAELGDLVDVQYFGYYADVVTASGTLGVTEDMGDVVVETDGAATFIPAYRVIVIRKVDPS